MIGGTASTGGTRGGAAGGSTRSPRACKAERIMKKFGQERVDLFAKFLWQYGKA